MNLDGSGYGNAGTISGESVANNASSRFFQTISSLGGAPENVSSRSRPALERFRRGDTNSCQHQDLLTLDNGGVAFALRSFSIFDGGKCEIFKPIAAPVRFAIS